jgi:hypothetical protein
MKIFCDADTGGAPFLRRSQDVLREKEGLRGIGLHYYGGFNSDDAPSSLISVLSHKVILHGFGHLRQFSMDFMLRMCVSMLQTHV